MQAHGNDQKPSLIWLLVGGAAIFAFVIASAILFSVDERSARSGAEAGKAILATKDGVVVGNAPPVSSPTEPVSGSLCAKVYVLREEGRLHSFAGAHHREALVRYGSSLACIETYDDSKNSFGGNACFDRDEAPPRLAAVVFSGKAASGMLSERKDYSLGRDEDGGDIVLADYSQLDVACLYFGSSLRKCWDRNRLPDFISGVRK